MSDLCVMYRIVFVSCRKLECPCVRRFPCWCSCAESFNLSWPAYCIQTLSSLVMTYLHRYHKSKEGRSKDSITEQCCLYCAALLLGCKTLETLRTMRDIFNSVASVMWRDSDASQLDRVSVMTNKLGNYNYNL
jgi:hypothetical protein